MTHTPGPFFHDAADLIEILQRRVTALKEDNSELLIQLKAAERAMSANPAFNAWDIGPSKSLVQARAAIAKAEGSE